MALQDIIRKYALQNAFKFDGNANPGTVLGRVLQVDPSLKKKIKEVQAEVDRIVKEINALSSVEQIRELRKYPEEEETQKEKGGLKDLPNVKGKVVMRFEPSPSGPLHIGHSYVLLLNYAYVKKYGGKLILRIADTNPENIDPVAYEQIPKDANWLCENSIKDVQFQSDRLKTYYKHAKELIKKDTAYICTCDPNKFKVLLLVSKPCPCRGLSTKDNLKRYDMMFTKYKQGEAVMRLKSSLSHQNPAMRDFPLMRINDTPHPRQKDKYRVWPLMNLAVAIDDMESKVTHTLRAKDHYDNAIRQGMIHHILGFKTPEAISVGKINFEGFELSTSSTREKIEKGDYTGWDDPQLPFIIALKRRGYKPQALLKYATSVGVTKTDKTVQIKEFFKTINAFNKDIIESEADRYFFVKGPVKIKVEGAPSLNIEMPLHPDDQSRGLRKFKTTDEFFISTQDLEKLPENRIFRLIDLINVIKRGDKFLFDSKSYEKYKKQGCCRILHWLPVAKDLLPIEVLMDDGAKRIGLGEPSIKNIKPGQIIQFERFAFVRFEKKEKDKYIFMFLHT